MSPPHPPSQLLRNLVLFTRVLRAVGIPTTPAHLERLTAALGSIDLGRRDDFRSASRVVLVGRREQLELFDRVFDLFWRPWPESGRAIPNLGRLLERAPREPRQRLALADGASTSAAADSLPEAPEPRLEAHFTYSPVERLRRRDFAELSAEEAEQVGRLLRDRRLELSLRRTRRWVGARRGAAFDLPRTLRRSLRHGGEALSLARRRRRDKPRPLVVLCDISGSMEHYSRLLLQFLYALGGATPRLEVFLFGTRLTRITRELRQRRVSSALAAAAAAAPDWGGGTRIGMALKRFNFDWGRRVLGQGAVVAVISDGWDRGEVEMLEREVARLARSCDRLLWLNPLLGTPGYEPLTRGIRAVLPHVDDFLPVHNLESLDQLAAVLRRPLAGGRMASDAPLPRVAP